MMHGALLAALAAFGVLLGTAGRDEVIEKIMKHHKKNQLVPRVLDGKGSEADHKQLLEIYQQLAKAEPPQGDKESWKAKTGALVSAAEEIVAKKPTGISKLKAAADCKACHKVHKPD